MLAHHLRYGPHPLRGGTDRLLLSLLKDQPKSGYHLIRETVGKGKVFLNCDDGTIYSDLYRLENEGLIRGEWQRSSNGQERRYYHITEKGLLALKQGIAGWQGFVRVVNFISRREGKGHRGKNVAPN